MKKHKNIPIFIPHSGCPNQCVFCNQKTISESSGYTLHSVKQQIENALSTILPDCRAEIAFFGGSFTGIPRDEMTALLAIAKQYKDDGKVYGIRLSTRPDYISKEILSILACYGVTDIELGVQSLSDKVLTASKRGHTAEQTANACRLIKEQGSFTLVGQMMLGLPFSERKDELATAKGLFDLGVDAIRIYPTVVLRDTPLEKELTCQNYSPLPLEQAVEITADILEMAYQRGVACLRAGLCENETLHSEGGIVQGPFHPAFGELAISEVFYRRMANQMEKFSCLHKNIHIIIPRGALSKAIGQKRCNYHRLMERFSCQKIRFTESADLTGIEVCIQEDSKLASQIT